jgi:ring-1,2-phenylacetyl-CoA epoxidase subunit PaaC
MASNTCEEHVELLLRIGDSALVLGQQLGALVGWAPTLEEELATANIALDLIGHATFLLDHAGGVEGAGRTGDDLAYLRGPSDFRNVLLAELPNADFAHTVVRQALYSAWSYELWNALAASTDSDLAAIAMKAVKEATYHVEHTGAWFVRLGDGTDESRERMHAALATCWSCTDELFADDDVTRACSRAGIAPEWGSLRARWNQRIDGWLAASTLERPTNVVMRTGGVRGDHSEHLSTILGTMQELHRAHPGVTW